MSNTGAADHRTPRVYAITVAATAMVLILSVVIRPTSHPHITLIFEWMTILLALLFPIGLAIILPHRKLPTTDVVLCLLLCGLWSGLLVQWNFGR